MALGNGGGREGRSGSAGGGIDNLTSGLRAAAERLATWSRRALVAAAVVVVVALALGYWWFHPALNLRSYQVWNVILVIAAASALVLWALSLRGSRHRVLRRVALVPLGVIAAFAVGVVLGEPFVPGNAECYARVLDTTDGTFASDIEQVDYADVPVIDRDSAILLGNRAMGSISEYVSQFEISDTYSMINYQGRPVRVSPLTYADLFKWWSNRDEGIPAYVLVDMVTQQAEVVRLEQPIRYSESEPLGRNIDRYAQLRYPTYLFDQKSFELDDDGTPWWVFPVQRRTIGLFGGTTIGRVVLVNACTGETADYAVDEVPEWVDRAYPADLIVEQYNWSGKYANGWLNSWLGQQGVVRTPRGTDGQLGYNYLAQGDDIYLYTGVSSVTANNSNVGFILVNQRTGDSRFYEVPGATEDSAMESAEGQVQNLGYTATYPLLLNVGGQPTYFMALKDAAGLVKMYAMINVEQYQSVATGYTVAECQKAYLQMMADSGVVAGDDAAQAGGGTAAHGTIATLAQAVVDGNSHFYVTLEGDGSIYDFALPGLLQIVTYRVGDEISFTYAEGDGVRVATGLVERGAEGGVAAGDGAAAGGGAATDGEGGAAAPAAAGADDVTMAGGATSGVIEAPTATGDVTTGDTATTLAEP